MLGLFLLLQSITPASAFAVVDTPRIEAVRADAASTSAPVDGWIDVTLPDDWSTRWPTYDGVTWYRVTWKQSHLDPDAEPAAFVEYLNMAGVIDFNGATLVRDRSLVEPLARMWNVPRLLALPTALLRGDNTLTVRISGMAAYQPGLGPVHIGPMSTMSALYEREFRLRYDLQLFGLAIGVTLGSFFLVLWFMRRRETAYGWFGALQIAWLAVAINQISTSTWPFTTTDAWEAFNTIGLLVFMGCWGTFVLRFCGRRWPRVERPMWIALALGCTWVMLAPHESMRNTRDVLTILATVLGLGWNVAFIVFAWRRDGRLDQRLLSICAIAWLAAGVHDAFVFTRLLDSNMYYSTLSENLSVIAVAFVLAWNFVHNLRRIEGFNDELIGKIDVARRELADTLQRQHEREVVRARQGERLGLAHDLHDGLSGALVSNILRLEHAPESMTPAATLAAFKELRDDLHLIIDTSTGYESGRNSLAELLVPLRFRMTRLLEGHDITCRWILGGLDTVFLVTSASLDLLRMVQEALVNVLKHSGARSVSIELAAVDAQLSLTITDDGVGFVQSPEQPTAGTGLRSLRARALRLQAAISIDSRPGATTVHVRVPLVASAT
ncbi:MAG: 7TM diverse intracellular signaling domain-containing protein [Dokdonella sp.]|uniref:sensor histidine kinase n=1 Tax=Dokdonella sp. TaxID=2291710 RepID=UPI0032642398